MKQKSEREIRKELGVKGKGKMRGKHEQKRGSNTPN